MQDGFEFGAEYEDVISGVVGIQTGYVTYITGCEQVLLTHKAKDGNPVEASWHDVDRLRRTEAQVVVLPTATVSRRVNGPDKPAPVR